jgi:hypothetical protein
VSDLTGIIPPGFLSGAVEFGRQIVAMAYQGPELILPIAMWEELFDMSPEDRAARLEELWRDATVAPGPADS